MGLHKWGGMWYRLFGLSSLEMGGGGKDRGLDGGVERFFDLRAEGFCRANSLRIMPSRPSRSPWVSARLRASTLPIAAH